MSNVITERINKLVAEKAINLVTSNEDSINQAIVDFLSGEIDIDGSKSEERVIVIALNSKSKIPQVVVAERKSVDFMWKANPIKSLTMSDLLELVLSLSKFF